MEMRLVLLSLASLTFVFFTRPLRVEACRIATSSECAKAQFVPGHNLGGEGFNIVTMKRTGAYVINMDKVDKANGTCMLCTNTHEKKVQQKLPISMVDWRPVPRCKMSVYSKVYESSESLLNNTGSNIKNDWKVGLEIKADPRFQPSLMLGGSHSRAANFAMEKSKKDKYSFAKHEVHCEFYKYRVQSTPVVSDEFSQSFKALPNRYSRDTKSQYRSIIDIYGTHFMRQVSLGGRVKSITAIKTCEASLNGLTDSAVKDCLDVEASATILQMATVKTEAHFCREKLKKLKNSQSFSATFNERHSEISGGEMNVGDLLFSSTSDPKAYSNWFPSLKSTPDVISYSLAPLHRLFPKDPRSKHLKSALKDYIFEHAVLRSCSSKCSVGSRTSVREPCNCVCHGDNAVKANCCPVEKGLAKLTVKNMRATGLWGDYFTKTDGSVKASYGAEFQRTAVIDNNDNPVWRDTFNFDNIKLSMTNNLIFEVYDADYNWNSDLLGKCTISLKNGDHDSLCALNHGTFYYSYKVTCAPSLGGAECDEYIPSGMSTELTKSYVSRNAIHVPLSLLPQLYHGYVPWPLNGTQEHTVKNPDLRMKNKTMFSPI
ncbi:perforin-1-like [Polypterus senegalus]|nr:perforin-1-like [Polypterus senegalus]